MTCTGKSASCLAKVAILAIALLLSLYLLKGWFPYLFYLRVPLLSGLLLLTLPLICLFVLTQYLANLFVLNRKSHLAFLIIVSVLAGLAVVILGGVIAANAPARFAVEPSTLLAPLLRRGSFVADALAILLALPTSLVAFILSKSELSPADRKLGAILGAAGALVILALVHGLPADSYGDGLEQVLVAVLSVFPIEADGHGYIENQRLTYGHLTAAVFLIVALLIELVVFFLFRPSPDKSKQRQAPALFYILELLLVWSSIFSVLTFSLDYFRIPSLLLFVAFSFIIYRLCKVDHFYRLHGKLPILPPEETDSLRALCARLNKYQDSQGKTLVVVCASGGGIQAAGWTARVLTGLQELFTDRFTRAIGLISSVSGGSVGALYFLDRFDKGRAQTDQLDKIFRAATEDSLGATGWGFSYPDLWRFAGLPFLHTTPRDRGAAIDFRWKSALQNPNETLRGWGSKALAGELPIPVFNSTLVENGRAYRLSPMNLYPGSPSLVDFTALFAEYDLDASTAALLSATFPYVTPITRNSNPDCDPNLPVFHVADGGYFDIFGVVTAVDWLDQVLSRQAEGQAPGLGIERVLIIQIKAFYEKSAKTPTESTAQPAGWLMAVLGPLFAIANTRTSTQAQRNEEDLEWLREKWNGRGVTISSHPVEFPPKVPFFEFSLAEGEGRFASTVRSLQNKALGGRTYTPPLSWKLTEAQKQAIEMAWNGIKNDVYEDVRKNWE